MTTVSGQHYLAAETALWLQLSCGEPWIFLGCHNLTGITVPRGDTNPTYCRIGKNRFAVQRTWRGTPGLGGLSISAYDTVLNYVQELSCAFNLAVLHSASGADEDPFNFDYLYYYNGVEITSEETDPHVVGIDPEGNNSVMLNMPGTFRGRVKVKKLQAATKDLSALTTNRINAVAFCDEPSCDSFGNLDSLGCQVGYAVTDGPAAKVLKTADGGGSWTGITSPFTNVNDPIVDVKCDGDTVLILNGAQSEYAFSWDAGDTWTVITTPTKVLSRTIMLGGTKIWMVGEDGFVYFSNNRGSSVSAQSSATVQDLNDVSAADALTLYKVGKNNAFGVTTDGGTIWEAKTGPATGIFPNDLYRVLAIPGTSVVFVGDEQGNVYRSIDQGDTWETSLAGGEALAGGIRGLVACDCNVILASGNNSDPYFYASDVDAVVYQSVDGGNSWFGVNLQANPGVYDLICCDVNRYWLVGEDGYMARLAGPSIA